VGELQVAGNNVSLLSIDDGVFEVLATAGDTHLAFDKEYSAIEKPNKFSSVNKTLASSSNLENLFKGLKRSILSIQTW